MTALLELHGAELCGLIHIRQGLTLEMGPGQHVCLIGGNASCKSTYAGDGPRHRPAAQRLRSFVGEDVTDRPTYRIRRELAIVPEKRRLLAPITALENMQMGPRGRTAAPRRTSTANELFPLLYERRAQLPGTLWGGKSRWWRWAAR